MKRVNLIYHDASDKYLVDEDGSLYTDYGARKMSDNSIQNGYIVNTLYGINGRIDNIKRHILIAKMYLPKPLFEQTQVNHINGIKTDNRTINLEWCTPKENIHHAWEHGLSHARHGSNVKEFAKLNEEQVLEIAQMLEDGNMMGKDIAELYHVHKGTISAIKCRKNWKHLTKGFNF